MNRNGLRRLLILWIALTLSIGGMAPTLAVAGVVGTGEVLADRQAEQDRQQIAQLVERDEVRDALTHYGVDPGEAEDRVAALSDEEAAELAERIEQQPAGAGVSIGATTILLLVIIWLLVR